MQENKTDLTELLSIWPAEQFDLRQAFIELTQEAESQPGTETELISRPGVSHSFRGSLPRTGEHRSRPVYCLVDVVLSPSDPWFLSVCFYEDEITDPEELGNPIPQGLFQETGYCFDVDDHDPDLIAYLKTRILEARQNASK